MLDDSLKTPLRSYLQKLQQPIELIASLDAGESSRELAALLSEIAALSPLITLSEHGDNHRRPSFRVRRAGDHQVAVDFAGIPLGHEFSSLVLALLQVGGHPPKVSDELVAQIAALDGEYQFETYYSLSCQNCPDVVQALNVLAILNPKISHVAIDGAQFQEEVEQRQVLAVPSIYLNGQPFAQGRISLEAILGKLDHGASTRSAARLQAQPPFDVLVVGAGPAGAAAAIYAARKGIRTGIASERFGGQVLDTLAIENFISVRATEGPQLAAALQQHLRDYPVELINGQRAQRLLPAGSDGLLGVELASGATLRARSVVLSPGARWRTLNVPGEERYRGRGVAYCPHCDGPLFRGKRVAVVGGGNSGVEAAIDLAGIVAEVTLIEFDGKLRADDVLQRKLHSLSNVRVIVAAQTTEVVGDGHKVSGLRYQDRATGDLHQLAVDGIFVQIGLLPNTDWLRGTLALSARGEIGIDDRGQTSLPGVFAAGDATTVPYKQIIIAMGAGATAALSAFDHLIRSSVVEPAATARAA